MPTVSGQRLAGAAAAPRLIARTRQQLRTASARPPDGAGSPAAHPLSTPNGGVPMLSQLWNDLFKPHVHAGSLVLRVGLAVIFLSHGYLKLEVYNHGAGWADSSKIG